MVRCEAGKFEVWLREQLAFLPAELGEGFLKRSWRGCFVGGARGEGLGLVGTLKSVRWEEDRGMVFGRVAQGSGG